MEETHREDRRKVGGLLWGLLALVVVALVIWWAWPEAEDSFEEGDLATQTQPVPPVAVEGPSRVTLAAILDDPATHVGHTFPQTEVRVAEVPSDRGFWIESEGRRMFALIIDQPREQPKNIQAGQSLRIEGGTLRDASHLGQIEGAALDADTRRIAEQQQIFLVVDEANIVMLDAQEARQGQDPLENE